MYSTKEFENSHVYVGSSHSVKNVCYTAHKLMMVCLWIISQYTLPTEVVTDSENIYSITARLGCDIGEKCVNV